MTIAVKPAWPHPSESAGRTVISYVIADDDNAEVEHLDARAALIAAAPDQYNGQPRLSIELTPINERIWSGRAEYGRPPSWSIPETGSFEISFDIGAQQQRVLQSLQTVNVYAAPGKVAPDFKGAINVTREGVQGTDVVVPYANYQRAWYVPDGVVNEQWIDARAELVGTVNADVIFNRAPGRMLCTGVSGTRRPREGDWAITTRWAVKPNVSNVSVGPISGIQKDGWDYLWVHHIDEEDAAAKMMVRRPVAAYIERIYPRVSHAPLVLL